MLRELGVGVWVAEVTPTRLAWAVAHGVPAKRATADYRSALGAVDAVDIVTPADSHLAIASMCLAAGRHCFVEEPLTMNADEGRRLVAAADRAKRVFAGFKRPRTDVGVLQTDGIHYVDLFAHLLGREATAATAVQRDFLGRGLAA